ncbi:biopolymer transporter ExbD [Betaproteobacteria bacterium SCN1]|jgi:biopolymer transport protein ExbD|nr:biopolymer transporter ExbD [Betaproteobacteria bacterium SCN1]
MALLRQTNYAPMSEINVTPMVDVMLVLLVIFMVTAPFLLQAVPVNLPRTAPVAALQPMKKVELIVDADGNVYVDQDQVAGESLETHLQGLLKADPELAVQLKADYRVAYGRIAEVMAAVNRAGVARMSFVTASTQPDAAR